MCEWHDGFKIVYGSLGADPASHKSNPSSIPLDIVDSYSVLPWVMWEVVTVVEGIP